MTPSSVRRTHINFLPARTLVSSAGRQSGSGYSLLAEHSKRSLRVQALTVRVFTVNT